MTLSQLKTFAAVCRHMSFTAAARELYLSQPAVSRQISALEEELGLPLFTRSRNTIFLTDAGRHLSRELVPLIDRLETVLGQARQISTGLLGHLYIGLLEDQCLDEYVGRVLQNMKRPVVQLSIRRMNFLELEQALRTDGIDLAIGIRQSPQALPGFCRRIYREEAMCLAIRRELLPEELAGREWVRMDEVRLDCPILIPALESFPLSMYGELKGMADEKGNSIRQYDFSSIAPMVAAGLAVAVVNESSHLSVDGGIVRVPIRDLPRVEKGLFWKAENQNPVLGRFLEQCGAGEEAERQL